MKKLLISCLALSVLLLNPLAAQKSMEISVLADKPVCAIQPTMWGVFFEDINFAADGGLYSELVKNGSFEFSLPLMGWKTVSRNGKGRVLPTFYTPAKEANPHYAEVVVDAPDGWFGLINEGFRGMGIKSGLNYYFSLNARISENSNIRMKAALVDAGGSLIGETELIGLNTGWQRIQSSIIASRTEQWAQLQLLFSGKGSIDIDMISLFPSDTWKGRPGGLRKDLVQMIADLKPGFIRFPGGCIVEGRNIENRYQWKTTIGSLEERKLIVNRWNMEVKDRQTPDYFQSFGLGFYEYFQLAEDIGAEPLPVINCGMSCQFNAAEVVPVTDLGQYIQDALDLIDFANSPASATWGKVRALLGHPAPFNLKYIAIGNEQWDEQYIERYREFEKVLHQQHPEIKIIAAAGPAPSGKYFDYAWSELKKLSPSIIDEHYYMDPEWFMKNAVRYDSYDRNGIRVFAGEYAAHGKGSDEPESRNNWLSALAEAAFMTGLDRNAEVVNMASYAPLLAHVDAWQWRPDLIWFDNLQAIGTPNYYVQKMFSSHRGTREIPALSDSKPLTGADSIYASASRDDFKGEVYIKIVNTSKTARSVKIKTEGLKLTGTGRMETLESPVLSDYNSIKDPRHIYPSEKQIAVSGSKTDLLIDPWSVNVVVLSGRK
ncbi:MAG: alpha-L-arabinofuranosidase C-terminal domain-containing protein [Bacteroidales bacterium]|jgi:alpha-L-arabinofuranosidase